jgi:hypothetical protein
LPRILEDEPACPAPQRRPACGGARLCKSVATAARMYGTTRGPTP